MNTVTYNTTNTKKNANNTNTKIIIQNENTKTYYNLLNKY